MDRRIRGKRKGISIAEVTWRGAFLGSGKIKTSKEPIVCDGGFGSGMARYPPSLGQRGSVRLSGRLLVTASPYVQYVLVHTYLHTYIHTYSTAGSGLHPASRGE